MSGLPLDDAFSMGASSAECLRSLSKAARQGVVVPSAMWPLARLDDEALETLLDLAQAFYGRKKSDGMATANIAVMPPPSVWRHWLRDANTEGIARVLGVRGETVPPYAGAADEAGGPMASPVLLPGDRGTKGNLAVSAAAQLCGMRRSACQYHATAVLPRETTIGGD